MKQSMPINKVLVAVDGSEQSLCAIRYAANAFPPDHTHIVLFHVREQLFKLFSDLDAYPHYKRRVTGLKHWATEQKMDISNIMDSAVVYFKQRGYLKSAITIKTPSKKLNITQDIVKESYNDYHAIVVGRTGWSRFKDWLIKSTAMKLVAKIKHIPIVVVGGNPVAKKILVAFDATHGAMRGVACVGDLVGKSEHHLQLYSLISHGDKFWIGDNAHFSPINTEGPIKTGKHPIGAHLEKARSRLMAEGMTLDQVSIKIHAVDRGRPSHIVQEAKENHFDSIVVGRRSMVTFIDEYLIGRVSDRVLKMADTLAVWII